MASELADRYEELHLLYGVDGKLRQLRHTGDPVMRLLDDCASHMNADVVAYIHPRDNSTLSSSNLSAPIHNLDLVLVEMRGDLFRYLSASRNSLILNEPGDSRRAYIFTNMPYKVMACPVFEGSNVVAALVLIIT